MTRQERKAGLRWSETRICENCLYARELTEGEEARYRMDNRLGDFIGLCYKIADYIDDCGENEDRFTKDAFGLGYKTASDRIRNGIVSVIELGKECRRQRDRARYAKVQEEAIRDFLTDIFGDEEIYCVNDEIKAAIKKAAQEIEEAWTKEHCPEDD